jgi:hypothetical protein
VSRGSRGVPGDGRWREDVDRLEESLLTDGTAGDIAAGDAQHEVPDRLPREGRRRGLGQERAALGERRRSSAIGEQAEVADADEAVGDDVEQEAPEELLGAELS